MRLLLIALLNALLTAPAALAGDPVPGTDLILEHNTARPGGAIGDRPPARFEAVTDRDGMALFAVEHAGRATMFVTPSFEGEAVLRIEGRDIYVPIQGQGRGARSGRAVSFDVSRGERVRVQVERPDRQTLDVRRGERAPAQVERPDRR